MTDLETTARIGLAFATSATLVSMSLVVWITVGDYRRRLRSDVSRRTAVRHFPTHARRYFDWLSLATGMAAIVVGGFLAGVSLAIFAYGLAEVLGL